jgi:hypothetical protein
MAMTRLLFSLCGALALFAAGMSVQASPLDGMRGFRDKVDGGTIKTFKVSYKGGERACVIVVGDHQPVVRLGLKVEDAHGKLVGEDSSGRDICAVIWYPPRDGQYTISVAVPHISGEEDYNVLTIALK